MCDACEGARCAALHCCMGRNLHASSSRGSNPTPSSRCSIMQHPHSGAPTTPILTWPTPFSRSCVSSVLHFCFERTTTTQYTITGGKPEPRRRISTRCQTQLCAMTCALINTACGSARFIHTESPTGKAGGWAHTTGAGELGTYR